jgi:predicted DNA-binding protein
MPTTKKRINISVSKEMEDAIKDLAKRDQMPQATKAEQLIRIALEYEEDRVLSEIADRIIDTPHNGFLSHEEVWK